MREHSSSSLALNQQLLLLLITEAVHGIIINHCVVFYSREFQPPKSIIAVTFARPRNPLSSVNRAALNLIA
jgi:hypothetical protein